MVAQVGEERVLGKFGVLDFFAGVECPKPVERFCACAGSIDAEASVANESASFGEKVCGGFVECVPAAAACREVEIVPPHVARVQKPTCENIRFVGGRRERVRRSCRICRRRFSRCRGNGCACGTAACFVIFAERLFQPLEFFLQRNPLRGVAQNHLGDDLRFRETQQVVSQVLAPVQKRCFLDELQLCIRILAENDFA